MALLNRTSLMLTLDYTNEALLYGQEIRLDEQQAITRWIAARQGAGPGYNGLYSPTNTDLEYGVSLFTGEPVNSSAGARLYLGQEAARLICLFASQDVEVRDAYERASAWMRTHEAFTRTGTHCCGRCTVAGWRHFWVSDFADKEAVLVNGLAALRDDRDAKGKWKRFPFYYTLLALSEIDLEPARQELHYSLPVMERYLKGEKPGLYYRRRKAIVEKALSQVQ